MNATVNTQAAVTGAQAPLPAGEPDYSSRLSDGQANSVYAVAYQLSQRGKHEQAMTLFALLTMYRPREHRYTRAVAICFRKIGRYEPAIRYFARTMELHPQSYEPAFQLVECMLLLGQREQAIELLGKFIVLGLEAGKNDIVEQASTMLALLNAPQANADADIEPDTEEEAAK